ncbi:MAG: hypothetical protein ACRD1M_17740 [Terriglobales bacterium]
MGDCGVLGCESRPTVGSLLCGDHREKWRRWRERHPHGTINHWIAAVAPDALGVSQPRATSRADTASRTTISAATNRFSGSVSWNCAGCSIACWMRTPSAGVSGRPNSRASSR